MEVEADESGSFSCVTLCLHVSDTNGIRFPDCLHYYTRFSFHVFSLRSLHIIQLLCQTL